MSAPSPSVVLVTGATGFLGAEIARRLVERGDELHAFARATSDRRPLVGLHVTWHDGDLADPEAVMRAARATSAAARAARRRALVVHCGALISYKTADREAQRRSNVEGTRNVISAARACGFARCLHVSSVVAIGHGRGSERLDETSPWNNGSLGVDYATTKRAAEELVLAASTDLDVVVVNPGAIFGVAGRKSNTLRFLRLVAQRRGPRVAPPGSIAVLGVEDCAVGCLLALDRGRRGERYVLVERWLTTMDLFRLIARTVGGRAPRFTVPRFAWPAIVRGARVVDRIVPLEDTPPQALTMLGRELRFDALKARRELGWSPEPFENVLARMTARLRAEGLLDEPA